MNLFISSATDKIYLMLFEDEKIYKKVIHQGKNNHTETIYDLIDEMEILSEDINRIYVVNGPGSYTGLRVGVIFAKTYAMHLEKELVPVNLLEALYVSVGNKPVGIDAKGKKYFVYDGIEKSIQKTEDLSENVIKDPLIDLEKLVCSDYLSSLDPINYLEFEIDYVKNAI